MATEGLTFINSKNIPEEMRRKIYTIIRVFTISFRGGAVQLDKCKTSTRYDTSQVSGVLTLQMALPVRESVAK